METQENRDNLARLEKVTAELWRVVDLCNRSGYELSSAEFRELQTIKTLTASALDLGTR